MRSRVVQVDTQKITAARRGREALKLNLFEDEVVEVEINRVRPTRSGYFISGNPKGMEWGEVRLIVNGPVMVGTVEAPEGKFTIRSGGSGRHVIREIDPSRERFECEVEDAGQYGPSALPAVSSLDTPSAGAISPTAMQADDIPTEDGSEIRLLVVYTPALQAAQGGPAGMRALIDLFVQSANQAFEDSGINPRIVLAHSAVTDYVAVDARTDLGRLQQPDDGYLDEVHALRNEHAADLVHLLTNVARVAEGIASPLASEDLMHEDYAAFAVTANGQEQTFVHEIGHNFGLMHDRFSFGSTYPQTIFPYAFGYVNKSAFEADAPDTARWRTIMSVQNRCRDAGLRCTRLLRFSNPGQEYMNDPLGVPADSTVTGPDGPSDARTTVNNTARWVGSFRSRACTDFEVRLETPVAPLDGGEVILGVDAAPGCLWEVSSQSDFLTVSSEVISAGSAFVTVQVGANQSGVERTGMLTVAGEDIMVRQLATSDGICGRTPAVVQAIAKAAGLAGASECDQVADDILSNIASLDLQGQGVSKLKAGDFEGLSGLVTLELGNNQLSGLPSGMFPDLTSLEELLLGANRLTGLPEGVFSGLSELRRLGLDNNQFTELPEGLFTGLSSLEELDLWGNQLTQLPERLFADLTSLTNLYLHNNRLAEVPEGLFSGLSSLEVLGLGSNRLTELPVGLYTGLSNLRELLLFHNQLDQLPDRILADLSSLQRLDLASNDLIELPENLFADLANLEWLSLVANQLTQLPESIFLELPGLKILQLNDNKLTELPENLLGGVSKLTTLRLGSNRLESLPENFFSGLTALHSAYLDGNAVDPLPLPVALRMNTDSRIAATAPTGVPFTLVLPLRIDEGGTVEGDASSVTISAGNVESEQVSVTRVAGRLDPVSVDLGTLPKLPDNHSGYALEKAKSLPLRVLPSLLLTDSTLVGLSVSDGILIPAFTQNETNYSVFVAHSVSEITVTPAKSNSNATVAFYDANDRVLADADSAASGHQARLDEGENTIRIKVTAEDGTSTETYDLEAVRDGVADVCTRTLQVREAIMQSAGVNECTDVTAAHLADIQQLDLIREDISSLTPRDFAGLTALEVLDLRFNQLGSVPAGVFSGLDALQRLNMYSNRLSSVPTGVFSGLTGLQRLSLGENRLTVLPDGIFLGLYGLKYLDLGINLLNNLPSDTFTGLSALETLDLRGNRLASLLPDLFSELVTLQHLHLGNNQLSVLPETVFSGLDALQTLHLGSNRLASLRVDAFSGLVKLEELWLRSNRLRSLPAGIFSGLPALQNLYLSENWLTNLPNGVFLGSPALEELYLNRNRLDPLPLSVSLEKVGDSQFKAVAPSGAPFNLEVSVSISDTGMLEGDVMAVAIPAGTLESVPVGVVRVAGTEEAVTVDLAVLPILPGNHEGYTIEKDDSLPRVILPGPKDPRPARVTGLQVTAGAEQLEVSWPAVADADGYRVQWKSGEQEYDESRNAVLTGGDAVSHTITGLTGGTGYTIRVLATKANADDGPPSSEVTGVPRSAPAAQVTGVEVTVRVERLEVSWTAVSDAGGYKVQWKSGDEVYDEARL